MISVTSVLKELDQARKDRDQALGLLILILNGAEASDRSWHNWLDSAKALVERNKPLSPEIAEIVSNRFHELIDDDH